MRTLSRVFLAVFALVFSATTMFAQDESPISIGMGLESRYVWRGYTYNGEAPSFQPSFAYSVGGFEIGAWGAYSFSGGAASETDIYVSYTVADMLTFTVTDFFYHDAESVGASNEYFAYKMDGDHWIEASVGFSMENLPVSFLAAVNIAGDKYTTTEGERKEAYSSYLEATYSTDVKGVGFSAFAGFAISPENGEWYTGYKGALGTTGFVNVGVAAEKEIKVTDTFSIPVYGKAIFNPAQENYYIVFGMSL